MSEQLTVSKVCGADKQHADPCPGCPFSRRVKPGALGGSSPNTYIGQIAAGMWLPCHAAVDFSDNGWKTDLEAPQCAGAGQFREAVQAKETPHMLRLPPTDDVFSSYSEFLAHHTGRRVSSCEEYLQTVTPEYLAAQQLQQATVRRVAVIG